MVNKNAFCIYKFKQSLLMGGKEKSFSYISLREIKQESCLKDF